MQDCSNSSALAMELLQSCARPLSYKIAWDIIQVQQSEQFSNSDLAIGMVYIMAMVLHGHIRPVSCKHTLKDQQHWVRFKSRQQLEPVKTIFLGIWILIIMTVKRLSYFYNGNSCASKATSLYWDSKCHDCHHLYAPNSLKVSLVILGYHWFR